MSFQIARRIVVFLQQFFQALLFCCLFWRNKRDVSNTMIALEVFVQGKFMTFRELLVYFEFRLVFTVHYFFFICSASRQPITSVEFKFVARQVITSVIIRAAKLKFVAESRTRVYFAQHVASTCNTVTHREHIMAMLWHWSIQNQKFTSVSVLLGEYTYTVHTLTRHFGRMLHGRYTNTGKDCSLYHLSWVSWLREENKSKFK